MWVQWARKQPVWLFAGLLVGFVVQSPAQGTLPMGTWQTLAPMPTARAQHIAVTDPLTGDIYVGGGYNIITEPGNGTTGPSLNTVDVYHPASNTWSSAPTMPVAVRGAAAAYGSGKVVLFGGVDGSALQQTVQVYTISANGWTSAPLSQGAWESAAAGTPGGSIYVTGGFSTPTQHYRYEPVTGTVTPLAPLPTGRNSLETGLVAGKLLAVAGAGGAGLTPLAAVDSYDPIGDSWSGEPVGSPIVRMRFASGTFSDHFLAAGGSEVYINGGAPYFDRFDVYDAVAKSWSSGPNLPQGLREVSGAVSGSTFYVFGGYGASGFSNQTYAIALPEPAAGVATLVITGVACALRRRARRVSDGH